MRRRSWLWCQALLAAGVLWNVAPAQAQEAPAGLSVPPSLAAAAPLPHERLTELHVQGRTLAAASASGLLWERYFPAELGSITGPLMQGSTIYVGVGPAVLALDEAGTVLSRYDLSAPVVSLDGSGGPVRATVAGHNAAGGHYRETFTLRAPELGGGTQERVVFAPDPAVTLWAKRAADAIPEQEVASAWQRNSLNPFLGLRAALQAHAKGDETLESKHLTTLMASPQPFPVWVKLAARLDAAGYPMQAEQALGLARIDAARRGYDPTIRVSQEALAAYGEPSAYIATLLQQGRVSRAEVWLRHLRELHPRAEGASALYLQHAELLERAGRAGEASGWRRFAAELRGETLYGLGDGATRTVWQASALGALALALALVLAYAAVRLRYRCTQATRLARWGGRWRSWGPYPLVRLRYRSLALASAGERLALTMLAAALVLLMGGAVWADNVGQRLDTPALNIGTYGGAWAETGLSQLPLQPTPDAVLLRTLGIQLSGDLSAARAAYQPGRALPCIQNNLGVIAQVRGDTISADGAYRRALDGQPDLGAAAYNLGFPVLSLGSEFQQAYRAGEPRPCFPDDRSLVRALGGGAGTVWAAQWRDPTRAASEALQPLLSRGQVTAPAALLLAEIALVVAVLGSVLPAPRQSAGPSQPAHFPQHSILAWAVPGAGLLPWVWGVAPLLLFTGGLVGLAGSAAGQPAAWHWNASLQATLLPWLPPSWPAWAAPALALGMAYLLNSAALGSLWLFERREKRRH